MRFAPISERAQTVLLLPIIVPLVVAATVMFLCVAPIAYPLNKAMQWVECRRKAKGPHQWFAWRPVKMSGFYYDRPTDFAWLETVERTWNSGWSYRYPGELDIWERKEADTPCHPDSIKGDT